EQTDGAIHIIVDVDVVFGQIDAHRAVGARSEERHEDDASPGSETGQRRDETEELGGISCFQDCAHAASVAERRPSKPVLTGRRSRSWVCRTSGLRVAISAYHGGMDSFWVAVAWSLLPT